MSIMGECHATGGHGYHNFDVFIIIIIILTKLRLVSINLIIIESSGINDWL